MEKKMEENRNDNITHGMCSRHQGLLYKDGEKRPGFVDFDMEGVREIPDVIERDGVVYKYKGIGGAGNI